MSIERRVTNLEKQFVTQPQLNEAMLKRTAMALHKVWGDGANIDWNAFDAREFESDIRRATEKVFGNWQY